ncbi:ATP-dependent DNA helicase DinG [Chungangia koreensis]|uniref:3'-5' exonuclease DinG n=1 Tax=Chungangia koreensis TaxID=752657 RepID=A0ABV8X7L2_9LACT
MRDDDILENHTYAIVDLETTGHAPSKGDRMIQIAIVFVKNWTIIDSYSTFIHPGKDIPVFIQQLTNITNADIKDALPFEKHAEEIYKLLKDCTIVAHNADFDYTFLQAELKRSQLPGLASKKVDTVELAKILLPTSYSYKLQDLAADLQIPLENAHRADDDALATAKLFIECMNEMRKLPSETLEQLHKRSFSLRSDLSHLFYLALKERRTIPSEDTDHYAGIALKKKETLNRENTIKLHYPVKDQEKLDLLQKSFPKYEKRERQFEMMDSVWKALTSRKEIVVEASTGIGKSLAYLLPATIYAKTEQKQVIISTYTTHLLDQLLQEEIKKTELVLGEPIRLTMLKGMNHYVDLKRFSELLSGTDESYDETFAIMQTLVWLYKTETGDLDELNVSGGGQFFIDKIRKYSHTKIDDRERAHDFYEHALEKGRNAELIITNHAMLLTELNRNEPLLKNADGWVIDEAHQFISASVLREEKVFSYTQWKYLFGQIGTFDDDQLLRAIRELATLWGIGNLNTLDELERRYVQMVESFDLAIDNIVESLSQKPFKRHMTKRSVLLRDIETAHELLSNVVEKIHKWIDYAEMFERKFKKSQIEWNAKNTLIRSEWLYWLREMKIKASEWDEIFLNPDENYSVWIEEDKRSIPGSLVIVKRPIDVEGSVKALFGQHREQAGIIWTSGTMTVPENERFIANQLGLPESVPIVQYTAPESFYKGASLYIVEDMPDIQQVPQSEFIEAVADAVIQTVLATEGRCFVLFTSQDMLRKTVDLIQDSGLLSEYMLIAQGMTSGSRMRLLKSFQRFSNSVLFGTNSFWEGVDVPGEALSAVIVVRLPFSSPDEPVFKTRAELLSEKGLQPFTAYALPEAILRFRQGFGRLIRSSNDRGVFIVLDRRIERKSYGKDFINSLPPVPVKKVSLGDMVLELENWYTKLV